MILDIKPIRQEYFSCIDGVLATAAAYYQRPYELMFMGSLGFKYEPCKEGANIFGKKVALGLHNRSRDTLQRYHQIKIEWCEVDSYPILHDLIIENINNGDPIGVFLDGFYCPWNPIYQRLHFIHYVLISGYEKGGREYHCYDPYLSTERKRLSCECLKNGFKEYILFKKEPKANNAILLTNILKDNLYSLDNIKHFDHIHDNILLFANDLRDKIYIDDEVSEYKGDLKNAMLFLMIDMLGKHRTKFSIALQYASGLFNNNQLLALADEIAKSRGLWNSINTYLYKLYLSRNEKLLDKVYDKLKEIAELEYGVQINLCQICGSLTVDDQNC